ncbi:MAG: hypothetical protein FD135_1185 [Comamonadaceae bacterium]|nr:MAG: hypothetical protein FD135_1185 [Comamonadaceae bacterium]
MKTLNYPKHQSVKMSAIAIAVTMVAVGFAGCGGGYSNDSAVPAVAGLTGKVVDGYVQGAKLFADKDSNGSCETDTGVLTNATGDFTLPATFNGFTICASGGTDISTGQAFVGELKAPAGAKQITPLTTLVQSIIETDKASGKTTSSATAAATVATNLGLGSTDVLNTDPVAAATTNPKLAQTTVAVQVLLIQAANNVAAAATGQLATSSQTNALFSSAVAGVAKAVSGTTTPVDLTSSTNAASTTTLVSQSLSNTVSNVKTNPTAAATVVGVAGLDPTLVAAAASSNLAKLTQNVATTSAEVLMKAPGGGVSASLAAQTSTEGAFTTAFVSGNLTTTAATATTANSAAAITALAQTVTTKVAAGDTVGAAAAVTAKVTEVVAEKPNVVIKPVVVPNPAPVVLPICDPLSPPPAAGSVPTCQVGTTQATTTTTVAPTTTTGAATTTTAAATTTTAAATTTTAAATTTTAAATLRRRRQQRLQRRQRQRLRRRPRLLQLPLQRLLR